MASNNQLKILIIDNHDVVRKGLAMLVSRQEGLSVVAEAGTVAEAVEKARGSVPDVVLMDIRLPDGSGIEACREIRDENAGIKVLMLTSHGGEGAVMACIMAGASGYLLKENRSQEIVDAVRRVGAGQSLLDPAITTGVLESACQVQEGDVPARLTGRERKILELIAGGQTNLSGKIVKDYVSSLLGKLELSRWSQTAAILTTRRNGTR